MLTGVKLSMQPEAALKKIKIHPKAIDPNYTGSESEMEVPEEALMVSAEILQQRYGVCSGCDKLREGKCAACGCPVPAKLKWVMASCPEGKWGSVPANFRLGESVAPRAEPITSLPPVELPKTVEPPKIGDMAKSFFSSAVRFAQSGFPVTPLNILEERLNMCSKCEHWNKDGFAGSGQCRVCGCSTQAKLRMATSECPLRKWEAVK